MQGLARRLIRWTGAAVAFGLIAAAVLLTVLRLALPFADEYRDELEQRVGDYLGTPISIGDMEVEWHGLGPRLHLIDVEIAGPPPAREPVHFDEARVALGVSVGGDRPYPLRISTVTLSGAELRVRMDEQGRLSLLGAQVPAERLVPRGEAPPPVVRRIAGWLLNTDGLRLTDTDITILGPGDRRRVVSDLRIGVLNDGASHQLSLEAGLPASWGGRVRAVVEARGAAFGDWAGWSGRAYVEAGDVDLPRLLGLYELPVTADAGRADLAFWGEFGDGRITEVSGDLNARDLHLERRADGAAVRFERLGGRLRWHGAADGDWQLDAGALDVRRDGRDWPAAGFSVARDAAAAGGAGAARWRAGADFLRLEDAAALARLAPLPASVTRILRDHAPRADVRELRASGHNAHDFALRAELEDAAWRPVGRVPGARGIDARVVLRPDAARVRLATRDAAVTAPGVLAAAVPVRRADGTVEVERLADGGVRLRAPGLELANADVRGEARLDITRRDGAVDLDIAADFRDGDLAAAVRYLPVGPIPAEVRRYLDRMLIAGRVRSGRLRLDGRADAFPYRDGDGTFAIDLDVDAATVAFAPGWPRLDGLAGEVAFDGPALRIRADAGRLFGIEAETLEANVADLKQGRLAVRARADAPVADLVRLVNESPLARDLGRVFAGARGSGRAPLRLDLDIPLRDLDRIRVDGRLTLDGASVAQPRYGLEFHDLRGELGFSRAGITMDGVRARALGRPVVLDARVGEGPDRANVIDARASLGPRDLVAGEPPPLARRVSGRADWQLRLRVPLAGDGVPLLTGGSQLLGTRVDLPAPLGKAASNPRRLAFSLPLAPGGPLELRVNYGREARALFELRRGSGTLASERALLRFGEGPLEIPAGRGLHVRGSLQSLALGEWLGWARAGAGAGGAPGLGGIDVTAVGATLGGGELSNLDLEIVPGEQGWSLAVASNELTGSGDIPDAAGAGAPIRLRFDWIDLGLLGMGAGDGDDDPKGLPGGVVDPGTVPPLDVTVDRLKLRNGTFREVALVTSPGQGAMVIHRLEFRNAGLRMSGQGRWRGAPDPRTSLRLQFEGEDFGRGLRQLGYGGALDGGEGQVTADLAWPDAPWSPGLAALEGYARVDLRDGLIPEVDPGAARLLALLSLRALPQMLSLDFRGLVQEGYAFDTIEGRIDFADANAYSRGLKVDGPVGFMQIDGRTGLLARDYDQTIRFQPELSTSLPLIGGLAGGPVTGIAVALIQGLLRNVGADVEQASELRYTLTGSWDDPKVRRLAVEGEDARDRSGTPLEERP